MAPDLVKSAARTLELLETFARERRRLSAAELGRELDYPRSSMNMLLKSLVAQGYLAFDPEALTYFPTSKVTELGDWIPGKLAGTEALLATLELLRDGTGETVTLLRAAGLHMRVARVLRGSYPVALQLDEGTLFPMFGTAVGLAYLVRLPDPAVLSLLKRWNGQAARSDALSLEKLHSDLARVRDQGYAAVYDGVVRDAGAISVGLPAEEPGETLVVTIGGMADRIRRNEAKLARELRKVVRSLMSGTTPREKDRRQS
jgi:DNA-binding IclR family transcriptional regulator